MTYPVVERISGLADNLLELGINRDIIKKALGAIAALIPTDASQSGNMPVGGPIYELCRWGNVGLRGYAASTNPDADIQYTKNAEERAVQAKWVNSNNPNTVKKNIRGALSQLRGLTASGATHQAGNQELPPSNAVLIADIVIPEDSSFEIDNTILGWLGKQNKSDRAMQVRITKVGQLDVSTGDYGQSSKTFLDIINGDVTVRPAPSKDRDHVALTATLVAEIQQTVRDHGTTTLKTEFKQLATTF